ncbi:MAG: hypothetical protein GWM92_11695 [Gemmatimonadetes bacterium]|nr:hypothetical protein [Gemmatimonadota bacterium]NIR79349.1 hypothetical protein [Gemmatimonadota bacterium]NIT88021.1 hypothetical protein [Gemmatimonadota bacterium]NIU31862.1 hypothetical protein [Gemmatimonadota bacterium]NIU36468.1 hypothetical protein [Gemmatimonadota bacterium]
MDFRVTVRLGDRYGYRTFRVQGADAAEALRAAADALSSDVAARADLVELRVAADPDEREYVGDDA